MEFSEDFKNLLPKNLTTDKAIELLLASIAHEQYALGNIIDAEADKINHAVSLSERGLATLDEVREINDSAFKVLKAIIKKEMLLEFELDDLIDFIPKTSTSSTTSTTTTTTTSTATTTTRSTTTTTSTSTTTSRTCTSFTTTKHSRCKWLTVGKIMLLLICIASKNDCNHDCCHHENCEEDHYHKSNCGKNDPCKNDLRYTKSKC
ncbi:hypothetical protein JK636_02745 [Clostridium sp. YIM B02515]|uniref:Uncharacterized protein n=1 Tax=Clostridium rhizosphaerae TaxID=2803861 RepID=A0ABS1T7M6_9CLOT|nr:hypothetical protein [Clostridium rhizosphaerae]MBL4934671.1 hypothetical protein [Clostridium rhizosphaerae]